MSDRQRPDSMLNLVELDPATNGFQMNLSNLQTLEQILLDKNWMDKKIVILLICGLYRSGKSFQLNLLLDAHRHGQQQLATWLGPNHRVGTAGVPFRGGSQPDTQGIRAWPEPFLIREESGGEEVVLLLLDSQGLFDMSTRGGGNMLLFVLSALLASTMIYNVSKQINSVELQQLEQFVNFARNAVQVLGSQQQGGSSNTAVEEEETGKLFQEICVLIRDWPNPDDHAYGFEGGRAYLDSKLAQPQGQGVRELFSVCERVRCCLMPQPGAAVRNNKFTGAAGELAPDFIAQQRVFARMLLSPNLKSFAGQPINCSSWFDLFKEFGKLLVNGRLPEPQTIMEMSMNISYGIALRDALQHYSQRISMIIRIGQNEPCDPSFLSITHQQLMNEANNLFVNKKKLTYSGGEEICALHLRKLNDKIAEMYAELVQKNNTLHENKAKAEKASDAQTKAWHIDEMSNMLDKQNKKLEAEFDKNQKFRADQEAWRKEEIETWQKKYDDQGAGNEKLVSQISELTKQVKGMETDTEKTKEEIKTQDKKLADLKDQLANMPSSNGGFFEGLKTAVKVVVGAGVTVAGAVVGGPPGAAVGAAVAGAILEE